MGSDLFPELYIDLIEVEKIKLIYNSGARVRVPSITPSYLLRHELATKMLVWKILSSHMQSYRHVHTPQRNAPDPQPEIEPRPFLL